MAANSARHRRLAPDPTSPRDALVRAFRSAIDEAREAAAGIDADPAPKVHAFRKGVRRARALALAARGSMSPVVARGIAAELKEAQRLASPLRDATVMLATLEALPSGGRRDARRAALEGLLRARQAEAADPAWTRKVVLRAAATLELLPARFEAGLGPYGRRDLSAALERAYARARKARERAGRSARADDIHAWRKRVKELRDQLALVEPEAARAHKAMTKLANKLGRVTDLIVLRRYLQANASILAGYEIASLTRDLDRRVERRARALLRSSELEFRRSPRRFARRLARRAQIRRAVARAMPAAARGEPAAPQQPNA